MSAKDSSIVVFEDFTSYIIDFITQVVIPNAHTDFGRLRERTRYYWEHRVSEYSRLLKLDKNQKKQLKTLLLLSLMFFRLNPEAMRIIFEAFWPETSIDSLIERSLGIKRAFYTIGKDKIILEKMNRSFGVEIEPNNLPLLEVRSRPTKEIDCWHILFNKHINLLRDLIDEEILPVDYYVNIHFNWGIANQLEKSFINDNKDKFWLLFLLIFLPELPINRLIYKIETGEMLLLTIDEDVMPDADGDNYLCRLQTRWYALNFLSLAEQLIVKIKSVALLIDKANADLLDQVIRKIIKELDLSFIPEDHLEHLDECQRKIMATLKGLCQDYEKDKIYFFNDPLAKINLIGEILTEKILKIK